ncbi:hypothetical protein KAFR_0I02750 [Kazachstania africana CBS 2517]|uniref:DNA replication factor Cdt1 C-terminal domain-containing protein n=1 Tax=Kazachstania africana (strain ATCC 22294 / BCRC 22015 / CBS 2517 / CECT 1963 / NBRC 1671 / NRRL Y-8276) TaxID=1071382 RepID=H2B0A4_KAZAF|nr:hypothetical protein KAFR_0I02750 [Kazachstania africana CBS 2517]CCF60054.1 hypothetical protein KAFR_0I02750 [Kazachstania africana CBS 2517]
MSRLPVIDLDAVSSEDDILPVLKAILVNYDTFLLKNYANTLDTGSLGEIDLEQGFDANFTGTVQIEEHTYLEQYIATTDTSLQFDRACTDQGLNKISAKLLKLAIFFGQLALNAMDGTNDIDLEKHYSTKLTRYYSAQAGNMTLFDGESIEYLSPKNYTTHVSTGILTIFPQACGIRYKPITTSNDDNVWTVVDEPDCLLFHTGTYLQTISHGLHSTSPIQIDINRHNILHLTVYPEMGLQVGAEETIASLLLKQQIVELPSVGGTYYQDELSRLNLKKKIKFYGKLFATVETIVSLNYISKPRDMAMEVDKILVQCTNLMQNKITEDDFLKMLSIWPGVYNVEVNFNGELTVRLPFSNNLLKLTNNSRKLQYVQLIEAWYEKQLQRRHGAPAEDLDPVKFQKRHYHRDGLVKANKTTTRRTYISNSKDKFIFQEKRDDSQVNLLNRIKAKERTAMEELQLRESQYDKFLKVKMQKIMSILQTLVENEPYTMTYLNSLVVDSLRDGNNPISEEESEQCLLKIQQWLGEDTMRLITVKNGLKVLKWRGLNGVTL